MKKRYCYLISSIFLMFLLFLFLAFAAGPDKWIECKSSCPAADNACPPAGTGDKCCSNGEKLNVNGVDNCCISNTWAAPSSDICDGLDNDCNAATADGSGELASTHLCALQSGVCLGSVKTCGGTSGWLACTSANYLANNANYESTESKCSDGLDNDCDGNKDCADTDCAGKTGPGNVICCQTVANCAQDDCVDEKCINNICSYTNRAAGATDECLTCQACDKAGGNCVGINADSGKSCNDDCSYCNAGICTDRAAGAIDECLTCQACDKTGGDCAGITADSGKSCTESCTACVNGKCDTRGANDNVECSACNRCDGTNIGCQTQTGETGYLCASNCFDCVSGSCNPKTEDNDGTCNDDCTSCVSGTCTNRAQCDVTECTAGQYCDAAGGNCQKPDDSSDVCLNCAPDQTIGSCATPPCWTWDNPATPADESNHEDAGKGYSTKLFDSNNAACTPASGGTCYDANNNPVNHKSALSTSACCGDIANEWYKLDYHGAECTNTVNDCVWSDGNAQSSDTGNKENWCYLHEWYECKVNDDIGKKAGASTVCCAGTSTTKEWTPNSLVKTEDKYSCIDGLDNDCDTKIDCADSDCAGLSGPGGVTCCQTATIVSNCVQSDCVDEKCTSNICDYSTKRSQCDTTECLPKYGADYYCDAAGGTCKTPDASSAVCLNCAASYGGDKTIGVWTTTSHEDKGIGWSANTDIKDYLFNSDGGNCVENDGTQCYDSSKNKADHKPALATGSCCGDDANEWYKYDYYGGECTSDKNDCVWGSGGNLVSQKGDAQDSNTGNEKYWCYLHEWYICKEGDANTVAIGTKVGDIAGNKYVTCAGTAGSQKWTTNKDLLPENQYSCTDGLDNDGDTKIDCADSDCAGTISGSVKDTGNNPIGNAKIDVLSNAVVVHTTFADASGSYTVNDNQDVICGSYDLIASASKYVSETKSVQLQPNEAKKVDFTLTLGTTCEADCTYAGDDLIHAECQGINGCDICNFGCAFCNPQIAANSCNLAKPGWIRSYSDPAQPQCQATGCVMECGKGCPIAKIETKASITCDEENLLKVTKLVVYKGKLAKLNIVVCG